MMKGGIFLANQERSLREVGRYAIAAGERLVASEQRRDSINFKKHSLKLYGRCTPAKW